MKIRDLLFACHFAVVAAYSSASNALLIQGPSFINPSTAIATCSPAICLGFGVDINQIADGDSSNFNGFAGAEGALGSIRLDLQGVFDLDSFLLWNDLNVNQEGVETFRLDFYDSSDVLIESTATLTAPIGQFGEELYLFDTTVQNVSRVDMEILSVLPNTRVEIREVAFNGTQVPLPTAVLLFGSALIGIANFKVRASKDSQGGLLF